MVAQTKGESEFKNLEEEEKQVWSSQWVFLIIGQ